MASFMKKYREAVAHSHGWEVALTCDGCGLSGVPEFKGWSPAQSVRFGDKPTVFADLVCTGCGRDLKSVAGREIVRLFSPLSMPPRNKRALSRFLLLVAGIPLLLSAGILAGILAGWWTSGAFLILSGLPALAVPAIFHFNYQVHSIRRECPCGTPAYVFMGMLGRSYCYRCSSCGRMLRLRD